MNANEMEAAKLKLLDWGARLRDARRAENEVMVKMFDDWLFGAGRILTEVGIVDLAVIAMHERES